MKTFKGNVKPYVEINGYKRVDFDEVITLEEWQINSRHFQFAIRHGWVVSAGRDALILNRATPQAPASPNKAIVEVQKEAVREMQKHDSLSPAFLTEVLDKQTLLIQGMQKSYEAIQRSTQKTEPAPQADSNADVLRLLGALVEQQKILVEQSKQASGMDPQLVSALLSEIRSLGQTDKSDTSSQMVSLLAEIKEQLANQKTQVVYNNQTGRAVGTDASGFKIHEVEEKYVAKIEELNVKDSKIVTQQTSTGGTDDALAVLRKLKGK